MWSVGYEGISKKKKGKKKPKKKKVAFRQEDAHQFVKG
jgi:hypothetical protein